MSQRQEIKQAIEQILGSSITMRDDSENPDDALKNDFVRLIKLYQGVWKRQNDLLEKQGVDLTSYDENYFKVIEGFVNFCFDEGASDAILFYIYSRKNDKNEILPFIDKNGKEHNFKTIDDLWEFLLYWAEEIMRP